MDFRGYAHIRSCLDKAGIDATISPQPLGTEDVSPLTISYGEQFNRDAVLKALGAFPYEGEGYSITAVTPELNLVNEDVGKLVFADSLDGHTPRNSMHMAEYVKNW